MFTPFLIKSRCSTGNLAEKIRPGHSIKGVEIEVQEALPKPAEARERSFHGISHGDFSKKSRGIYHLAIKHSHGKIHPFLIGKPLCKASISMCHLYHGYVK